jgi:hypothetical protein
VFLLRWLGRPPEDFVSAPGVDVGEARLPQAGADHRLRWDLHQLHRALNDARQRDGLTWSALAAELECTPSRLTGLRTATLTDMELAMRITQRLGQPAATFIHAAQW